METVNELRLLFVVGLLLMASILLPVLTAFAWLVERIRARQQPPAPSAAEPAARRPAPDRALVMRQARWRLLG
jgi:hypothetical protein